MVEYQVSGGARERQTLLWQFLQVIIVNLVVLNHDELKVTRQMIVFISSRVGSGVLCSF